MSKITLCKDYVVRKLKLPEKNDKEFIFTATSTTAYLHNSLYFLKQRESDLTKITSYISVRNRK